MSDNYYIGLDLGGTRIRTGRFSPSLALEKRSETLTLDEEGFNAVLNRMVEQIRAVWPTEQGTYVSGLGVSVPGPVEPVEGILTSPPNLKGWANVPLRRILEEKLGVPVFLGNDANLAALAEAEMGAGRGYKHVIYITVSTGIGSGIIVDGKLLVGSHGLGAECGHIPILLDNDRVSTLEKEAAGPALARQAVAALEDGERSLIRDLVGGDLQKVDGKAVGEAAKAGDPLALKIVARAGKVIGLGMVGLLHTFNPQIIIIGGGVAKGTKDLLFRPIRETIERYSLDSRYWKELMIAPALLGEDVCLIGAGALAARRGQ